MLAYLSVGFNPIVLIKTLMRSDFTMIPVVRKDSLLEDLKDLAAEVDDFLQQQRLQSIIFRLDLWTDWDPDVRRIVGETEEEGSVRSQQPEVSDVFTLSV